MCSLCGRGEPQPLAKGSLDALHVHHIVYRSEGGKHLMTNLIALCHHCHDVVHSDKHEWQPVLLEYINRFEETGRRPSLALLHKEFTGDHPMARGEEDHD